MAKKLEAILSIRDDFSNASKEYNRALKLNKAEMKNVQSQLNANEKDTEALARKETLLAESIKLTNQQISAAEKALRAENVELDKKKQSISQLEKEVEDLTKAYKKNVAELGEEDKQTKKSLTSLNKKTKELKTANREYDQAANNAQKYNLKLVQLNGELQDSSRQFAKTELYIQSMNKELVTSSVAVENLDKKLDKLGKKDFDAIANKLMGLGVGLSAALATTTALGSNASMAFSYGNTKINTIAKLDDSDLAKMANDIRELSDNTGQSISSIQEAYYQALSSGMEFEQVQTLVTKSIQTSKASFAELSGVIDVATSIMNAWKLSTEDTDRVMSSLYMTAELGKVTVTELSNDLGRVVASASQAGLEIEQVLSAVAQASLGGIQSSLGITYLNSMLTELSKSGTVASDIIKEELGMSFQQAISSGMELSEVIDAIEKSDTSLMDAFGSQEAARFASVLSDGEKYLELLSQIEQSTGAVDSAFSKVEATQFAEFEKTMTRLKNSLIELGVASKPIFDVFVDGVEALSETMQNVDTDTVKATAAVSALTLGLGAALKVATKLGNIKNGLSSSGAASILSAITGFGAKGAAIATGLGGIALAVTGICATFDALNTSTEEQTQKVKDQEDKVLSLQSQYEALNGIDSSKRSDSQQKIIDGLEKEIELNNRILQQEQDKLIQNELFGAGKLGSGTLGNASGRELDITQTKEHIAELEKALEYATSEIEKDKLIIKIGEETSKLNTYIEEFTSYMNDLGEGYDLATDDQKALIDELKVFQNELGIATEVQEEHNESIDLSTELLSQNKAKVDEQVAANSKLTLELDTQADSVGYLNECIDKLSEGQSLSGEETNKLINLFPQLNSEVEDLDGTYRINIDTLSDLADQSNTTTIEMINDQIDSSKSVIEETKKRIQAYEIEMAAMQRLSQQGVVGYKANAMHEIDPRMLEGMSSEEIKILEDNFNQIGNISANREMLAEAEKSLEQLEIAKDSYYRKSNSKSSGSKSSSSSKKDGSKSKLEAELEKKFKDDVNAIKKYGQDLEYEISKVESQLQLAKNKEDQALVESLSKQLTELYGEAPKIDARMAEELRLLKDKATTQEQVLELEGQIKDLSLSWYDKKNRQLEYERKLKQDNIELMEENLELIEKEIDKLGEKLTLELEKSIYGSGGKAEWEELNDKKIDAINKELDALKEQTKEKEKQEALEKHQLEMAELKEKLENAKKQRTVKDWEKQADGSYQWVWKADAELVGGIEQEIADKQAAEDKRLEEEKRRSKEETLRKEIELLQKEQRDKENHYNQLKEDLMTYLTENKEALAENGIETLEIVSNNMTLIGEEFDLKMDGISDSLKEKLDKIRDMFDEALSMSRKMDSLGSGGGGSSSGGNIYGNKGDSGKYYHQYPDGTIEVSRPDGSGSIVKPGDNNYNNTVDAMDKDGVGQKYPKQKSINMGRMMMDEGITRNDFSGARELSRSSYNLSPKVNTPTINNTNNSTPISINRIELPNVKDGQSFMNEMKGMASRLLQQSKLMPSGE